MTDEGRDTGNWGVVRDDNMYLNRYKEATANVLRAKVRVELLTKKLTLAEGDYDIALATWQGFTDHIGRPPERE